jgi:hypothetical protein
VKTLAAHDADRFAQALPPHPSVTTAIDELVELFYRIAGE